jgi:hypothetical protein
MNRRKLLKLLGLVPFCGPAVCGLLAKCSTEATMIEIVTVPISFDPDSIPELGTIKHQFPLTWTECIGKMRNGEYCQ